MFGFEGMAPKWIAVQHMYGRTGGSSKLSAERFTFFLDSSMVEHAAVNRGVVGSSPTRGVWEEESKSKFLRN